MGQDVQEIGTLRATYSFSTGFFTPYATPGDIVGLINNGTPPTRTCRILRLSMSCTQTTAGINNWFLLLRSTADTGGTPTAANAIPNDQGGDKSALLTVNQYTTAPTPGTLVNTTGLVKAFALAALAPAATTADADITILDDEIRGQPITLRAGGQGLYLNFGGAAVPIGLSICLSGMWSEA